MMETESVEGGAAVSYSLPVLPMALGLVFAATMLLALTTRGLAGGWVLAVLAVPVLLVVILAALGSRDRLRPSEAPSSPDEVLRTRYSLGEITREQYQDGLVEILRDRYIRGIIDLGEYERRVARVFSGGRRTAAELGQSGSPGSSRKRLTVSALGGHAASGGTRP